MPNDPSALNKLPVSYNHYESVGDIALAAGSYSPDGRSLTTDASGVRSLTRATPNTGEPSSPETQPRPDALTSTTDRLTPKAAQSDGEQFLRLKLFPDNTALLPMQHLSEVLTIPIGQVVPIPNMPPWVMGIYNWRGDILWVADLSHFLGFVTWEQQSINVVAYTTVVLNAHSPEGASTSSDQLVGLIVNRTEDIEWCNPENIQSSIASNLNPAIAQFLQGYWLKPNSEMLAVLDGNAILDGMSNL